MLTIEMLRQSAALTGLTDAQFSAIAEMSRNDEQTVIGTRIGELHGQYDKDIFGVTGIKKNDGEKSYDYTKRVLSHYKAELEASSGLQGKLDQANAKVAELTKKIENGEIGTFDSLLRVLRTLGLLESIAALFEEEQMSPSEYYEMVNKAKRSTRKRAVGKIKTDKEESEW